MLLSPIPEARSSKQLLSILSGIECPISARMPIHTLRPFSKDKKAAADDFQKLIVDILDQSLTSVNQTKDPC
jgi:hypothetical protein